MITARAAFFISAFISASSGWTGSGAEITDSTEILLAFQQLRQALNSIGEELSPLLDADHSGSDEERKRRDELSASFGSARQLEAIATQLLQFDVGAAFTPPSENVCHGHIFSDGTVGVHEVSEYGLSFTMLVLGGGMRGH
jgi:hypothetical protein